MREFKLPKDTANDATDRLNDSYGWLRSNNPLGVAEVEVLPFRVVTKHADLLEISRNQGRAEDVVSSESSMS